MNYESESFRNGTKVEGRYPNYFKVGHNNFEFLLDIDQFYPENEYAQLYTRIVTNPDLCENTVRNPARVH